MADVEKVEPFKEQALTVLKNMIDAATQAGDFIKDQIPFVIRELLTFNTVKDAFMIAVGVLLMAGGILWIRYCLKRHNASEDKLWSDWDVATIPGWIIAPIGIGIFAAYVIDLLKITLAPRVWLIEYAAGLVR